MRTCAATSRLASPLSMLRCAHSLFPPFIGENWMGDSSCSPSESISIVSNSSLRMLRSTVNPPCGEEPPPTPSTQHVKNPQSRVSTVLVWCEPGPALNRSFLQVDQRWTQTHHEKALYSPQVIVWVVKLPSGLLHRHLAWEPARPTRTTQPARSQLNCSTCFARWRLSSVLILAKMPYGRRRLRMHEIPGNMMPASPCIAAPPIISVSARRDRRSAPSSSAPGRLQRLQHRRV